jgi:phospholipid/cholesterol/gamma-HCH transport system permease protein
MATADAKIAPDRLVSLAAPFDAVGRGVYAALTYIYDLMAFIGQTCTRFLNALIAPRRLRLASITRHLYESGWQAVPIILLLSLGTTMVLFYQGANQLQKYGADLFTINLTVISLLREMGVLITSIMVAGRSGSAFASEIGVMKLRGDVDVLRSMGVDPVGILVVPRLLALLIALPSLTFIADVVGLIGGYVMSVWQLDISFPQYIQRLQDIITPQMFCVGMIKAPVFAFLIALICTHQGMKVEASAEQVGHATTRAVVLSIFAVIMTDALFSLLYSWAGM